MREHIKAFLLASSLAFGIPTFVEADPLERAANGAHEMRAMRWLRRLDLSEAQRDQIFGILHSLAVRADLYARRNPEPRGGEPHAGAAREARSVSPALSGLRDFIYSLGVGYRF